jgi:tetratricopeptide (TPR) repeat protein
MQVIVYQYVTGSWRRFARSGLGLLVLGAVLASVRPAAAQAPPQPAPDPLAEARDLYNRGRYEAAIDAARRAVEIGTFRHAALVVLGRAGLERFRQTADPADLSAAREALRQVDASRLDTRDRLELVIGLGEALYLDDLYLPAADILESALDEAPMLGPSARDQLLDWWASALDRHAQARPPAERAPFYARITAFMTEELERDAGTGAAAYWLAVAARATGDLDRAWDLARSGWVRAQLTRDRGAALRPDLDRLVTQAIIPERARRVASPPADLESIVASMLAEWEAFKEKWIHRE